MAAIVFDLDGTLVDSAPDIAAAANRMLADRGEMPLSLDQVIGFIGHGIPNLVRLIMEERAIPTAEHAGMTASMLAHYTAQPADLTRPYPGVIDALDTLRSRGHRLGVCTNKFRAPAMQILQALDMAQHFDAVLGGDSLPVKKPDPAPLLACFDALGGERLIYVGDSEVDAETALAAGIDFALFTRGYRKAAIETLPHAIAFDDFTVLPDRIFGGFGV